MKSWIALIIVTFIFFTVVSQEPTKKDTPSSSSPSPVASQDPSSSAINTPEKPTMTYFDEFVDNFRKGGTIMWILLLLSLIGVSYICERLVNLNQKKIADPELFASIRELGKQGQLEKILNLCQQRASFPSKLILSIIEHKNCSLGDIQTVVGDMGARMYRLQIQRCYPLAIIATLSPLLGLLGTIFGMIGAFGTVASVGQMGDASILADDISKALVTTAGGLIVGIPMLAAYHFFKTRTNYLFLVLEENVSNLISEWFMKENECNCSNGDLHDHQKVEQVVDLSS